MNTVSTRDEQPTALPLRLVRRSSALGNLIRKEYQDSREALITGLVVFWLLPALLELINFAAEWRYGTFPLASWLLVGAGWLYAIIVGAHTVCRDWGKAEEYFLLAQPVSPRMVVWAKLTTGAVLVAGVIAVVVAWETMLAHWGAFGTVLMPAYWGAFGTGGYTQEWHVTMISVACVMAVGYALAFAAAVMSRQMLASTVVASLMVMVWAILPLLSSSLTRFGALVLLSSESRTSIGVPFVLVSVLGLIICTTTSFFYSTRERVIRLGHKQLAWAVGLVMLTLVGVAMTEVGNSLRVRDQTELFDPPWGDTRMIQRSNHFFAITAGLSTQAWQMATFRVADNGRIQDLRRVVVPGTQPSGDVQNRERLTGFAFDENGHLVVSGSRHDIVQQQKAHNDRMGFENSWRITLAWPDGGEPEIMSRAELTLPADKCLLDIVSKYYQDNASSYRYAYIVSCNISFTGVHRWEHPDTLYVFDWSEGSNPTPRFVIPLKAIFVDVSGGKLYVGTRRGDFTLDADHPEALLDEQSWPSLTHTYEPPDERFEQFERPGSRSIQWDRHGNLAYLSDLFGLRIVQQTRAGRWEIVGENRASPLAMLFRSSPQPKVFDDSVLIEHTLGEIIAYDVSNPSRPRRVGFFNADWSDDDAVTQRHLVLRESNLITVLDRPDRRYKNNP